MNQTLHLVNKDAGRLRWAILAWLLIAAATAGLMVARPALDLQGIGVSMAIAQLSSLVSLIELVTMVLIVSWLVHEDPAANRDAFWLTRPINWRQLSTAKIAVASAVLVCVPLIAQLAVMRIFGLTAYDTARATPSIVLTQAAWVTMLMAGAALTPSIMRYAIVLVGAGAAFVLFEGAMITTVVLFVGVTFASPRPEQIDPLPGMITSATTIAASIAIVLLQYRYRHTKWSAGLAAIAVVTIFLIPIVWPADFRRLPDPDPGAWAQDQTRAAAQVDAESLKVSDEMSFRARGALKKRIAAPVRLSGLPNDFYVQGVQATSRLDVAGKTLSSVTAESVPVSRVGTSDTAYANVLSAMQGALGTVRLLISSGREEADLWPVLLSVTHQDFAQFGHAAGRLTSTLDLYLARATVAGSIPLEDGATLKDDRRRLDIVRIDRRGDGCTVDVRLVSVGPLFRPRIPSREEFVLRNVGRQEAVRAGVESSTPGSSSPFGFLLGMALGGGGYASHANAPGFSAVAFRYRFPAADPMGGTVGPVIDAGWLSGAELVRINIAYAGHLTRPLTIENFRMNSNR
jgi:hypothetical protein